MGEEGARNVDATNQDTYKKAATPHYLPLSESDVLFPHCYVSQ